MNDGLVTDVDAGCRSKESDGDEVGCCRSEQISFNSGGSFS